jgi:SAM-dependent methyltransferase
MNSTTSTTSNAGESPAPDGPAADDHLAADRGQAGREYVLGTGEDELARLGLQHRLWSDAAHSAWRDAGVAPGQRVLDVGCGPGYAAFDLAQIVGAGGAVVGVDESERFIGWMNAQAVARGLPTCSGIAGDVQDLGAVLTRAGHAGPADAFDLAYARWLLCFVPAPRRVVAGVTAALRPGGRFVVHDYFNYTSMTMAPRRASHDRAVAATAASWRARGGDPDVAGTLPRMLEEAGMRVTAVRVHQRVARGSDSMFAWPDVWWRTYAPKLVAMGLLTRQDQDELFRDLDEARDSTSDYIVVPPVFEIIAVKPA